MPDLAELFTAVLAAADMGASGINEVLPAFATTYPQEKSDMLKALLMDCAEGISIQPGRPILCHAIETIREHHRIRQEWQTSPTQSDDPATRFFYDGTRYFLDTGTEYVPLDQRSITRHLKRLGVKSGNDLDAAICNIQTDRFINYAGPLAGYKRGLHIANSAKILATSSPSIIRASPGHWPTIQAVLEGLLGDDPQVGNTQLMTFMAWLKVARESLVAGRRRPGQALALCGPRGSGKSLLIDLVELALGGRRANPYPSFSGKSNFNGDLAGAELLAVDDEAGSTDIRARKTFAASIKSCLFSGAVRIEAKHKSGFMFQPCWRMVLALNDEPEALLILPPLSEDVADKITLLQCHRRPLPMPAHTLEERERFFQTLKTELPAMLAELEGFPIPTHLQEERCGVKYFHHPELLASLRALSPEAQLEELIDRAETSGGISLPWTGTANDLKALLVSCNTTGRDADKLLGWHAACGSYLAKMGERVEKLKLRDGIQQWRILKSGSVD
jgi:hypothetical protein